MGDENKSEMREKSAELQVDYFPLFFEWSKQRFLARNFLTRHRVKLPVRREARSDESFQQRGHILIHFLAKITDDRFYAGTDFLPGKVEFQ